MKSESPGTTAARWRPAAYSRLSDFGTLIHQAATEFGDQHYLLPAERGIEPISFRDVEAIVRGFEVMLEGHGVGPAEPCAVISNNSTAMVLHFLSVLATGRVFVPINPNSSADDISYIVRDSAARTVIYETTVGEKVEFLRETCELVPLEDTTTLIARAKELASNRPELHSKSTPDSIAEVVYTTGTTGRPKGVLLTHKNLLADLFGIGQVFGFDRGCRFLTVTPLFHNSGQITTTLIPLYCGGVTTAIRPDMGFINFWHYVDRFEPAWSLVMPSHIALMLDRQEGPEKATLKGILCGGAKLEPETQAAFEGRFAVPIFANYGLTESASIATCVRPDDGEAALGSVGRPLDINQVRIFKMDREALPQEVGEIRISGDNVFGGYLNLPELSATKVQDGWLHTGDLGFADKRGFVHIVDRIDNMMLVGGENVYPSEIEQFVPQLGGISEGFVLSIPHRILGRELVLVYKLSTGGASDHKSWKTFLQSKLVNFKVPRRFIDVRELGLEDLPKSQSGKLFRKRLERLLEEKLTPAQTGSARTSRSSPTFMKTAAVLAVVLELDVADIHEGLHMDQVPAWDSLAHLRLIVSLEQEFGVVFSPAETSELIDVRAILDVLERSAE